MSILDQSFSPQNFEIVFNKLNRRGKIDVAQMSIEYQKVISDIKNYRSQIRDLKSKKRSTWTVDDKLQYDICKNNLAELKEKKKEALHADLLAMSNTVCSRGFRFSLSKHVYDGHEEFTIDKSEISTEYAIFQLQHNLKHTFQIEMTSRHHIMLSLKRLLNAKTPLYIIRTDVSGFFESIPQDSLYRKINDNSLLSYKSKAFINGILHEYEILKDTTDVPSGIGVPRGVGISSLLSEIYMKDIDRLIKTRKEVVYYVRYVDDIFIVLSSIGQNNTLDDYYSELNDLFAKHGLILKTKTDTKCQLIDYVHACPTSIKFEYLGYCLEFSYSNQGLRVKYGLSQRKKDKIVGRINNAFTHFEQLSKVNIKQARRDLLDSLDLISGNIRLHNSKNGVKVGLFYNSDLLDDTGLKELTSITNSLHCHPINVHHGAFMNSIESDAFVHKLQAKINGIDLRSRWEKRIMFDFPISRVTEIMRWL